MNSAAPPSLPVSTSVSSSSQLLRAAALASAATAAVAATVLVTRQWKRTRSTAAEPSTETETATATAGVNGCPLHKYLPFLFQSVNKEAAKPTKQNSLATETNSASQSQVNADDEDGEADDADDAAADEEDEDEEEQSSSGGKCPFLKMRDMFPNLPNPHAKPSQTTSSSSNTSQSVPSISQPASSVSTPSTTNSPDQTATTNYTSHQASQSGAAQRNKGPILDILKQYFTTDQKGRLLEIASGTGVHICEIANTFPNLMCYPSDYDSGFFQQIGARVAELCVVNVKKPQTIDVSKPFDQWGMETAFFDSILVVNLLHISPWEVTLGLFAGANQAIKKGSHVFIYGPFKVNNQFTTQSNADFDAMLKTKNPSYGLRDIDAVNAVAQQNGFTLVKKHEMPSNNFMIVWKKN